MTTETTNYAVVCWSTKYGPTTDYYVVAVCRTRAEAEDAMWLADQDDTHGGTGLRMLEHNEAARGYVLAEVVGEHDISDWDWDTASGYCKGDPDDALRAAGWTDEQIAEGCDGDHEAIVSGIDAMLASSGLIAACDSPDSGPITVYVLRLID